MIIGGYEFPDKCPTGCPEHGKPYATDKLCYACPIYNCSGDIMSMEPEQYRPDWAKEFHRWFDEGMKGDPLLLIDQEKKI